MLFSKQHGTDEAIRLFSNLVKVCQSYHGGYDFVGEINVAWELYQDNVFCTQAPSGIFPHP